MNILLVQVYLGRQEPFIYPIGLARLSSALKKNGHDVTGLDMNTCKNPYGELESSIRDLKPDMIGFSLRNIDTTQYRDPFLYWKILPKCVDIARRISPDVKIAAGGGGFSLFARTLMDRIPGIDYGFIMEADESLVQLLENPAKPETCSGLYYRENDRVKHCPPVLKKSQIYQSETDLSLFSVESYLKFPGSIGIESKNGCDKHCAYCTYPFLSGSHLRTRNPSDVVAEMRAWHEQYKVETFHFVDTLFNNPPLHAKKICRELIDQDLHVNWIAWFNERLLDQELLELAMQAGCVEFAFSPDGITRSTLGALGKDLTPADIFKTYRWALQYPQMNVSYNFFISPPGDTLRGVLDLFFFAAKVKLRLGNRGRIFLGNIRIEPDTPILNRAARKGLLHNVTDLLPETPHELRKLFYVESKTRFAHLFFNFVFRLKSKLKRESVPVET